MSLKKIAVIAGLVVIVIFLGGGHAAAQKEAGEKNGGSAENSKLVLRAGLDCFYNSEYACAEDSFKEYMKLEPADSVGNWRAALNYYFWLRFKQKVDAPKLDEISYRELTKLIQGGIEKAELQEKETPQEAGFYLAIRSSLHSVESILKYANGFPARDSFKVAAYEAERSARLGSPYGIYLLGEMNYQIGRRVFYERWPLDTFARLRFRHRKGIAMIFSVPFKVQPEFAPDVWLHIFRMVVEENKDEIEPYITPEIEKGLAGVIARYPRNEYVYKHSLLARPRGTRRR